MVTIAPCRRSGRRVPLPVNGVEEWRPGAPLRRGFSSPDAAARRDGFGRRPIRPDPAANLSLFRFGFDPPAAYSAHPEFFAMSFRTRRGRTGRPRPRSRVARASGRQGVTSTDVSRRGLSPRRRASPHRDLKADSGFSPGSMRDGRAVGDDRRPIGRLGDPRGRSGRRPGTASARSRERRQTSSASGRAPGFADFGAHGAPVTPPGSGACGHRRSPRI